MQWPKLYQQKLASPEKAAQVVKSGDRVVFSNYSGHPACLARALSARGHELEDVKILHAALPIGAEQSGVADYLKPEMAGHFKHISIFVGGHRLVIDAIAEGRAEFLPISLSEVAWLFRQGIYPVDVAFVLLPPPDDQGFCSYGVDHAYPQAAEAAKLVVAEVDDQVPRTYGQPRLHISDIDYIVECSHPLPQWPDPHVDDVVKKIAGYVAELIPDGATLQLGYGDIPDALCSLLTDRHDLGIHTEVMPASVLRLAERGILTGARKTLNPGKVVAAVSAGNDRFYRWLHDNPLIEMRPFDYTNSVFVIAQCYRIISINSFLQVDLFGNVNSEMVGGLQYTAVGGQLDFMRGVALAPEGKSVLVNTSTTAGGKKSRIVPSLGPVSTTVPRTELQYLVTEYGVVYLRGKTTRERAKALIEIAHPDFRDWLYEEARRMRLA